MLSIIALIMEGKYWILCWTLLDLKSRIRLRTTVPRAKERWASWMWSNRKRQIYMQQSERLCVVLMCVRVTALMGWENNPPLMKQIYRFLVGLEHSVWLEVRCVWECKCVCVKQTHDSEHSVNSDIAPSTITKCPYYKGVPVFVQTYIWYILYSRAIAGLVWPQAEWQSEYCAFIVSRHTVMTYNV